MQDLTTIDWQIYNILKEQTDWISQKDLALLYLQKNNYHTAYEECLAQSSAEFHNNNPIRKVITKSIRKLNQSNTIQKIILSGGKGVKIANEEEFDLYIERQMRAVKSKIGRISKIAKKGNRNGQCRITFGKYERDFIEAFKE